MRIINRYIIRHIVVSVLLVVAVLACLDVFINISGEMSSVGRGHYDLWHAFLFVLMRTPFDLYQFFPLCAVLGTMLGLGRLASTNQLMVIRATGYSLAQVIIAVVQAAIILLIPVTLIGEGVAPQVMAFANHYRAEMIAPGTKVGGAPEDVWLLSGHNFLHIQQVDSNARLSGVTLFQFNNQQILQQLVYANSAHEQGTDWVLRHPRVTKLSDQHRVSARSEPSMKIPLVIKASLLQKDTTDTQQQTLFALYRNASYRARTGLSYHNIEYAFWQRLIQPLTTIIMVCLGVPFMFGSLRSASLGLKVMVGVFIGAGFYILNQFLGLFSVVFSVPPLIAAVFPTLLFALICVYLLRRVY